MSEQTTSARPFRDRIGWDGSMSWREFARALEECPEQVEAHFRVISAGGHTVRPELLLTVEREVRPDTTQTSGPPGHWTEQKPILTAPHPRTYAESHYGEHEEKTSE